MFLAGALVTGHIYIALSKPGALDGILRGTVSKTYATEHHPKWVVGQPTAVAPVGLVRLALAAVVVALGLVATALLVGGWLHQA
jgi:hypothetical protein